MANLLSAHHEAVQRLAEGPGLGVDSAQQIIAEVGATAATFPSPKHLLEDTSHLAVAFGARTRPRRQQLRPGKPRPHFQVSPTLPPKKIAPIHVVALLCGADPVERGFVQSAHS
jgi:hypothetical protein